MVDLRFCFLFLLLIFFPVFADARIAVTVDENAGASLYQFESREFVVSVVNTSESEVADVFLRLEPSQNIAVLVGGEERMEYFISLHNIQPGEVRKKAVELKALSTIGVADLKIYFSDGYFENSYSAKFNIIESPLRFELRQLKEPFVEEEKVELLLVNNSSEKISFIRAVILPSKMVSFKGKPFELKILDSNGSATGILNYSEAGFGRPNSVVVRIFFDDSKGTHVLEKSLSVSSNEYRDFVAIVAVLAIIGFVFYYFRKKSKSAGDGLASHESHERKHDSNSH